MLKTAGTTISIKGNVKSDADFYFDGELEGTIEARRSVVTIGPNARVLGRIRAREIIIAGTVLGDMFAVEHVGLRSTGSLNGNISTVRISIQDGAVFKGRVGEALALENAAGGENKVLEGRYSKLVDLKYARGLTAAEQKEMDSLFAELSAKDADFYDPILQDLDRVSLSAHAS